jgi:hypothetical protein
MGISNQSILQAARAVCEKRTLDPELFNGATIVAVNGSEYDEQDDLFDALKDSSRPKTILFELAKSEEAERLREFVDGPKVKEDATSNGEQAERSFSLRKVEFIEPGELGIEFGSAVDNSGLVVKGFIEGTGGIVLATEQSGKVNIGDKLTHINDECVIGVQGDGRTRAIQLLEAVANQRPLSLTFVESYLHPVVVEIPPSVPGVDYSGGPSELILRERQISGTRRIFIDKLKDANGMAENSGIFIGDHLVFLNGIPVGVGCRWLGTPSAPSFSEVCDMMKDPINYPIGLTFARPMQTAQNRWGTVSSAFSDGDAETICVTAESYDRLKGGKLSLREPSEKETTLGTICKSINTSRSLLSVMRQLTVAELL